MNLIVNGEGILYEGDPRLGDYLKSRRIEPNRVAVLVNGDLVPLRERDTRVLADGDRLEILAFAGGG